MYLEELPATNFRGKKLDSTVFEKVPKHFINLFLFIRRLIHLFFRLQLSAEQLAQLYELMHATKDVWKPVETDGVKDTKP